jgi:thiol-disulfide isomerase/thioredoxin
MKRIVLFLAGVWMGAGVQAQSSIAVGATCPDFTVTDVNGNSHNLYAYCDAGKYVVVDFFAYWCGPCASIAPTVHQFYEKYGCNQYDVIVIGIESDANSTLANLNTFKQNAGLPASSFPNVLGSQGGSGVKNQYGVSLYPTVVLIAPDKKMVNNDIWPIGSVGAIEAAFPQGAITAQSCASVANLSEMDLSATVNVYPNPAVNELTVFGSQLKEVTLIDASGREVYSAVFNKQDEVTIDVSNLQTGVYVVRISAENGVAVKRFSKI